MKRVVVALALLAAAVLTRPMKVSTAVDPAQVGQWPASSMVRYSGSLPPVEYRQGADLATGSQAAESGIRDGAFAAVPDPWRTPALRGPHVPR